MARVMGRILFPEGDVEGMLRDLERSVWLDPTEDAWTSGSRAGNREPLWLDLPDDESPNAIVLGYYVHATRKIVLRKRTIQVVEDNEGLAARFGAAVLFRVVLAHEMAHWFTWMRPPETKTGTVNNEVSEALAEMLSWATFSKGLELGIQECEGALNCQYWLNEEAPIYWYRVYWLWLVLFGMNHEAGEPGHLRGESHIADRFLAHSQADGNVSYFSTCESILRAESQFPFPKDEPETKAWNPWGRALRGYEEAFSRLIEERERALKASRNVAANMSGALDL